MRTYLALASASLVVLLGATAGAAAPAGLKVTDPAGDANGVNSQGLGLGLPVPSIATAPAQLGGGDLVGLDFRTVFRGKKAKAFTVTMRLSEPVQQGVNYLATMQTSVPCGTSSIIQLGYQDTGALVNQLAICQSADPGGTSTTLGNGELAADGRSIVWTISPDFKPGVKVDALYAASSVFVLGVFDELTSDRVYTYGR
jgi:hypothetical protein